MAVRYTGLVDFDSLAAVSSGLSVRYKHGGIQHRSDREPVVVRIVRKARVCDVVRHCVLHIGFAQHLVGLFCAASRGGRAELIVARLVCLVIHYADRLTEIVESIGVFSSGMVRYDGIVFFECQRVFRRNLPVCTAGSHRERTLSRVVCKLHLCPVRKIGNTGGVIPRIGDLRRAAVRIGDLRQVRPVPVGICRGAAWRIGNGGKLSRRSYTGK